MLIQYFVKGGEHLGDTEGSPPRVGELLTLRDATLPGNVQHYYQVLGSLRIITRMQAAPKLEGASVEDRWDSLLEWISRERGVLRGVLPTGGITFQREACEVTLRELSWEEYSELLQDSPA